MIWSENIPTVIVNETLALQRRDSAIPVSALLWYARMRTAELTGRVPTILTYCCAESLREECPRHPRTSWQERFRGHGLESLLTHLSLQGDFPDDPVDMTVADAQSVEGG